MTTTVSLIGRIFVISVVTAAPVEAQDVIVSIGVGLVEVYNIP